MMLVDCQACPVRDVHCADCMVTALTVSPLRSGLRSGVRTSGAGRVDPVGRPPGVASTTVPLDRAERRAVSALLAAGLVTTATANAARAELDPAVWDERGEPDGAQGAVPSRDGLPLHRARRAV